MDLSLLIPVVALSILVERLLETGINLVEINYPLLTQNPTYSQNKQIITSLVGIVLGILSAFMLNIQLFAALNIGGVNAIIDMVFTGAIAGTLGSFSSTSRWLRPSTRRGVRSSRWSAARSARPTTPARVTRLS